MPENSFGHRIGLFSYLLMKYQSNFAFAHSMPLCTHLAKVGSKPPVWQIIGGSHDGKGLNDPLFGQGVPLFHTSEGERG